jgi:hypothetical protein
VLFCGHFTELKINPPLPSVNTILSSGAVEIFIRVFYPLFSSLPSNFSLLTSKFLLFPCLPKQVVGWGDFLLFKTSAFSACSAVKKQ